MKRRFEFRLERVRRVRELEERVARSERAQAETLARAAEASRDQARAALDESRAALRGLLEGEVQPREILTSQRALEGELARLRRKVESARTQRIQAERMAELHRERKSAARALEELRERARQRHIGALEVADNAALDEVAQRLARLEAERRAASAESASRSGLPAADHPARAS